MEIEAVWFFGWVWVALLGALVGSSRGQPGAGFMFTLFFGPLGLVAAATLPLTKEALIQREMLRASAVAEADLRMQADRGRAGRSVGDLLG